MAWTLRLRGATNGVTKLELPDGAETKLHELKAAVAAAACEDVGTLVLKAGFPPRELSEDGGQDAVVSGARFWLLRHSHTNQCICLSLCLALLFWHSQSVSACPALGVLDKDTLVLDRKPGASEHGASQTKKGSSKRKVSLSLSLSRARARARARLCVT